MLLSSGTISSISLKLILKVGGLPRGRRSSLMPFAKTRRQPTRVLVGRCGMVTCFKSYNFTILMALPQPEGFFRAY
jgi:hypothetical protein